MAERLSVRIIPSDGGMDTLTVEDAMRQVLDAFELLSGGDDSVVWRLVSASTNSPFTVVAEAQETEAARRQKRVFSESLQELADGRFPTAWKRLELQGPASSLLRRSGSGISVTEFRFDEHEQPLLLSQEVASTFSGFDFVAVDDHASIDSLSVAKKQVGSISGVLAEAMTYYGRPAFRIKERKTNRLITCVVDKVFADAVSREASMQDVWMHRRVDVRGLILYQASGEILRIEAQAVRMVGPIKSDELPSLRDNSFTGGLTAAEYLERFRAGELG